VRGTANPAPCCHLANDTDLLTPVVWAMAGDNKQIDLWSELTQNVIRSSHCHSKPSLKISCKSVQPFSRNVADKETKKSPKTIPRPPTGGGVTNAAPDRKLDIYDDATFTTHRRERVDRTAAANTAWHRWRVGRPRLCGRQNCVRSLIWKRFCRRQSSSDVADYCLFVGGRSGGLWPQHVRRD